VEKRPSRGQRDGKTVLEKAQERENICNMEIPNGIIQISTSVTMPVPADISFLADDVGINLGDNSNARDESIRDVMKNEEDRAMLFDRNCEVCLKAGKLDVGAVGAEGVVEGDVAPSTPNDHLVH
jgi:hypothetical protein